MQVCEHITKRANHKSTPLRPWNQSTVSNHENEAAKISPCCRTNQTDCNINLGTHFQTASKLLRTDDSASFAESSLDISFSEVAALVETLDDCHEAIKIKKQSFSSGMVTENKAANKSEDEIKKHINSFPQLDRSSNHYSTFQSTPRQSRSSQSYQNMNKGQPTSPHNCADSPLNVWDCIRQNLAFKQPKSLSFMLQWQLQKIFLPPQTVLFSSYASRDEVSVDIIRGATKPDSLSSLQSFLSSNLGRQALDIAQKYNQEAEVIFHLRELKRRYETGGHYCNNRDALPAYVPKHYDQQMQKSEVQATNRQRQFEATLNISSGELHISGPAYLASSLLCYFVFTFLLLSRKHEQLKI